MLRRGLIAGSAVAAWLAYSQARRGHDQESVSRASAPSPSVHQRAHAHPMTLRHGLITSGPAPDLLSLFEEEDRPYGIPSKAEEDAARAILGTAMQQAEKLLAEASEKFSEKFPKWQQSVEQALAKKEKAMINRNGLRAWHGEPGASMETITLLLAADYKIWMLDWVALEYARFQTDGRNQPMQDQLADKRELVLRVTLALKYLKWQDPFIIDEAFVGKEIQEAEKLLAAAKVDPRFSEKFPKWEEELKEHKEGLARYDGWSDDVFERNAKLLADKDKFLMLDKVRKEYEEIIDNERLSNSEPVQDQLKADSAWVKSVVTAGFRSLPAAQM